TMPFLVRDMCSQSFCVVLCESLPLTGLTEPTICENTGATIWALSTCCEGVAVPSSAKARDLGKRSQRKITRMCFFRSVSGQGCAPLECGPAFAVAAKIEDTAAVLGSASQIVQPADGDVVRHPATVVRNLDRQIVVDGHHDTQR